MEFMNNNDGGNIKYFPVAYFIGPVHPKNSIEGSEGGQSFARVSKIWSAPTFSFFHNNINYFKGLKFVLLSFVRYNKSKLGRWRIDVPHSYVR